MAAYSSDHRAGPVTRLAVSARDYVNLGVQSHIEQYNKSLSKTILKEGRRKEKRREKREKESRLTMLGRS